MGASSSNKNNVKEEAKPTPAKKFVALGLPQTGKTSLMHRMVYGEPPQSYRDILIFKGIDFRVVYQDGVKLHAWDSVGGRHYRVLSKNYYKNASGIIFLIDSSDVSSFDTALDYLNAILQDEMIANTTVMVAATKQDLEDAVGPEVIEEKIKEKCTVGQGISLFVMPMSVTSEEGQGFQLACRLFLKTLLRKIENNGQIQTGLIPRAWETAEKEAEDSETEDNADDVKGKEGHGDDKGE